MGYMLIPILLLKSQLTLHTYSGEQNPKILSYNIFLYNLSGLVFQISSSQFQNFVWITIHFLCQNLE